VPSHLQWLRMVPGRIVNQAVEEYGGINIVVNNTGMLRDKIFHKITVEDWRAVIDVHLNGVFNVSNHAAAHFRQQGSGAFIHMSSTSGLIGNYGQSNYAAAKLGIAALSKSFALDMERFNVTSNCISPFAWSRMIGTIPNSPDQEERLAKLKKMTSDELAPIVVHLASDKATDISGQIFAVRGNEIFLMSQPLPIRSVHRQGGWTPETIADHAMPVLSTSFLPTDRSPTVFNWDPPE